LTSDLKSFNIQIMSEQILNRNLIDVFQKSTEVVKNAALLPLSFARELHNRLGWRNGLVTLGLTLLPFATAAALWNPAHSYVMTFLGAVGVAAAEIAFTPRLDLEKK
jgi:hypothetical protein